MLTSYEPSRELVFEHERIEVNPRPRRDFCVWPPPVQFCPVNSHNWQSQITAYLENFWVCPRWNSANFVQCLHALKTRRISALCRQSLSHAWSIGLFDQMPTRLGRSETCRHRFLEYIQRGHCSRVGTVTCRLESHYQASLRRVCCRMVHLGSTRWYEYAGELM